jgi:hypothetical protein
MLQHLGQRRAPLCRLTFIVANLVLEAELSDFRRWGSCKYEIGCIMKTKMCFLLFI